MIKELENRKEKVLVTGATGMLGSRLVFDLIQEGYDVRAIYRDKNRIGQFRKNVEYYGADSNSMANLVEWVEADLLDYFQLTKALDGIEMVYHCAAMVSFNPSDRSLMFHNNIKGTSNLVNICLEKGIKRICHVSSVASLGKTENGGLIDEETSWIPEKKHSGYSISKFHSEMEIWRGISEGLDAVIVNPTVIIGPGDWRSGSPAFFSEIDKGLKFFTNGINGFVDVRDVSKAMLLLTNESNIDSAINNRYVLNAVNLSYESFFKLIAVSIGAVPPKYQASKWMLGIVWKVLKWYGIFSGTKPLITRETVISATNKSAYDGSKITRMFGFRYREIEETIAEIGAMYQKINGKME
jgi:nucleoside-diphosphate-sugar epimerase